MRLRFFLDECVDEVCRRPLRVDGHQVITAREANLQGEPDDVIAAYSWKLGCVLVTHDEGLAKKLRSPERLFNHVVYLDCKDYLAEDYLRSHGETIVALLTMPPTATHRIVRMTADGAKCWYPEYL